MVPTIFVIGMGLSYTMAAWQFTGEAIAQAGSSPLADVTST
jgi:hypothetical protein